MLLPKQGLRPPQGYVHTHYDNVAIKGRSWEEVMRKVVTYRRVNGFPKGEPMVEILEQAAAKWPTFFWTKTVRGQ